MTDYTLLAKLINDNDSFLLTTHVNPDADALGSEMAFYKILKLLNKDVRVVNHSETPYYLEFFDDERVIEKYDEEIHKNVFEESDVLVVLDLNQSSRIVKLEKGFLESSKTKICVDHHEGPPTFVDYYFGNENFAATAEIIYEFINATNIIKFNKTIAEFLYAGIATDTGLFRFEKTTPNTMRIAATLMEHGVVPALLIDQIFDRTNFSRVKLLGEALSGIKLSKTGKVGYMVVTQQTLKDTGALESEVDGFVNYCLGINGVEVGLLFFELKNGIKISYRSKGKIPVNKLAGEYGGGGHYNASGSRLYDAKLEDYLEKVIIKADEYILKYK